MRLLQLVPSVLLIGSSVSAASVWSVFSRPQADQQVEELSGTIATIDTVSLRVRPDEGSVMTFVVDDPSSLPLSLVAGTRVTVKYETREGGGRRLLSVGLAFGSNAPPPEVPTTFDASAAAALPLESAVSLRASAGVESSLSARDARAAPARERRGAAGPCPLELVAVVLLVATGALLVIASWR
jgi:hypothetical protein